MPAPLHSGSFFQGPQPFFFRLNPPTTSLHPYLRLSLTCLDVSVDVSRVSTIPFTSPPQRQIRAFDVACHTQASQASDKQTTLSRFTMSMRTCSQHLHLHCSLGRHSSARPFVFMRGQVRSSCLLAGPPVSLSSLPFYAAMKKVLILDYVHWHHYCPSPDATSSFASPP